MPQKIWNWIHRSISRRGWRDRVSFFVALMVERKSLELSRINNLMCCWISDILTRLFLILPVLEKNRDEEKKNDFSNRKSWKVQDAFWSDSWRFLKLLFTYFFFIFFFFRKNMFVTQNSNDTSLLIGCKINILIKNEFSLSLVFILSVNIRKMKWKLVYSIFRI